MSDFKVMHGRTEYMTNPVGLDVEKPRFSWHLASERRGARQTAYQILVASEPSSLEEGSADLWDSGRVESDATYGIEFGGTPLASRKRAWWTVRSWDENGEPGPWTEPAFWEAGLKDRSDWQAQWISSWLAGGVRTSVPAPYMRKAFTVEQPIVSARLYASALGVFEAQINGQRVGTDEFAPGWTDYAKRVQYHAYDVTGLLQQGENAIGAILGDGWYTGHIGWHYRTYYGDRPSFLGQLELTLADGSVQTIATDASWSYAFGPILESDLLMGETYDARQEIPGWSSAVLAESEAVKFQSVRVTPDPVIEISGLVGPPVRATQELTPISDPRPVDRPHGPDYDGVHSNYIFDLGQNMIGRVRLKISGPAGTTVSLRHAEVLEGGPAVTDEGGLYTANLRTAKQTDYYTLKGEGEEIWEPRFTFHGFRFVELAGYNGTPTRETITGVVLHSDTPKTGTFECSDPLLNQLQQNIDWGQRSNFLDIPTDCPQRDERLGWTGDAQVFVRTASWNRDVAGFFTKWARDTRDAQQTDGAIPSVIPWVSSVPADGGAAWSDAAVICPWTLYLCYGDKRILEDNYDVFTRFIAHQEATSEGYIRPVNTFEGFGDWLSIKADTPKDLIATAFFAYSTSLVVKIAKILGKTDDAAKYTALLNNIKKAFCERYLTPGGYLVAQTQTAYTLALHFDLVPEDVRSKLGQEIVKDVTSRGDRLSTGFAGSSYLNWALTATGNTDTAYRLLHQTECPSWLYAVTQGATTIWEHWDGWTKEKGFQDIGMNSYNHYAYGAIGAWLYAVVAGIDLDEENPGYKHIVFRPRPGGQLTSAKASLHSMYGHISSEWIVRDGKFDWHITVPPNTSATVFVPTGEGEKVSESGIAVEDSEGLTFLRDENGARVYAAVAGSYHFSV